MTREKAFLRIIKGLKTYAMSSSQSIKDFVDSTNQVRLQNRPWLALFFPRLPSGATGGMLLTTSNFDICFCRRFFLGWSYRFCGFRFEMITRSLIKITKKKLN